MLTIARVFCIAGLFLSSLAAVDTENDVEEVVTSVISAAEGTCNENLSCTACLGSDNCTWCAVGLYKEILPLGKCTLDLTCLSAFPAFKSAQGRNITIVHEEATCTDSESVHPGDVDDALNKSCADCMADGNTNWCKFSPQDFPHIFGMACYSNCVNTPSIAMTIVAKCEDFCSQNTSCTTCPTAIGPAELGQARGTPACTWCGVVFNQSPVPLGICTNSGICHSTFFNPSIRAGRGRLFGFRVGEVADCAQHAPEAVNEISLTKHTCLACTFAGSKWCNIKNVIDPFYHGGFCNDACTTTSSRYTSTEAEECSGGAKLPAVLSLKFLYSLCMMIGIKFFA